MFGKEAAELMRVRKLESEELSEKEVQFHPELPEEEAGFCFSGVQIFLAILQLESSRHWPFFEDRQYTASRKIYHPE